VLFLLCELSSHSSPIFYASPPNIVTLLHCVYCRVSLLVSMKTVNPIGGLFAATSKYSYARAVISSHYPIISSSRKSPLTRSFYPIYIVGVVFAITFGSRRDVLLTLMFWRRNPTTKGTTHTSQPASLWRSILIQLSGSTGIRCTILETWRASNSRIRGARTTGLSCSRTLK
jgi:hypothetical protein